MLKDGRAARPGNEIPLSQIAELAGVSEATVSRVLNRRYGVASRTRERVEAALAQLNYKREARGEFVLVLVPSLRDTFFPELCERLFAEFSMQGLRPVIGVVLGSRVHEHDYVASLIHSGVAGVVFLSVNNTLRGSDSTAHQLLAKRGIPFVTFNGAFKSADAPVFSTDDFQAAELSVAHLSQLGHRRIGIVTGPVGNTPADRRLIGFQRAVALRGLDDLPELQQREEYSVEGGRRGAERLLAARCTAIVAASDEMALGAVVAARRLGLDVPWDISVVGYNNSSILEFTDPPLTSVTQPTEKIAKALSTALSRMIAGEAQSTGEVFLSPELVARASTAPVTAKRATARL